MAQTIDRNMIVRRAEFEDGKALAALMQDTGGIPLYRATFNTFNFSVIIENSFVSVIATSNAATESDEQPVIGFMAANDSLPLFNEPEACSKVLHAINLYIPAMETNSLFLNFWMINEAMKGNSNPGLEMVKMVLAACPYVDYILWVCPKSFAISDYTNRFFSPLKMDAVDDEMVRILDGYQVYVLARSNFLPKLLVREARVEDNDDLIPILRDSNPDILVGQEDYFLADLINSQDERNRFYVGLQRNNIVGMLATSLDVNVALIMKLFDIQIYSDIIVEKEERPLPPPLLITIVGDLRLLEVSALQEAVTAMGCLFINGETMDIPLPAEDQLSSDRDGDIAESKSPRFEGKEGDEKKSADLQVEIDEEKMENTHMEGLSPLQLLIEQTLANHQKEQAVAGVSTKNLVPPAIVVFGYPRSETEALNNYKQIVHDFDYIIEIHNSAEDAEDDEEDEFLQQHLDALEVLRENYFANEGKSSGHHHHHHRHHSEDGTRDASWRKVSVDGEAHAPSENLQYLCTDLDKILEHRTMKIEAQRAKDNEEPPKANAFAVTVFCLTEDFNSRGIDLLKMAFEDFPHHDYCLFMVSNTNPPPQDLLRCLNLVNTRAGVSFDQSLYVMHRSAFFINDHLHMARLSKDNARIVEEYAQELSLSSRSALLQAFDRALPESDVDIRDNPKEIFFVATIGKNVVGAISLSSRILTEKDSSWLKYNYCVDELVNFDRHRLRQQAFITCWALNPIYSANARRILQTIMRYCGRSLLYYQSERDVAPPCEIDRELILLKPRSRMQEGENGLRVEFLQRPSADEGGLGSDCPLYCITKHHLSRPKSIIAKRIVIVAGSSHSYSVLETLCSVPYLYFPNISVIMSRVPEPLRMEETLKENHSNVYLSEIGVENEYSGALTFTDEHFLLEQQLYALGLGHKARFIRGNLTDIDRENRAIVVSNEQVIEYDVLVISNCVQDTTSKQIQPLNRLHPGKCADAGVFGIGNPSADYEALKYVKKRYTGRSEDVVVNGAGIEMFTAVSKLIKYGISPSRITVVTPEEEGKVRGYPERKITDPMVKGLLSVGVKICWGFSISEVTLSKNGFIESVDLQRVNSDPVAPTSIGSLAQSSRATSHTTSTGAHEIQEDSATPTVVVACIALINCHQLLCEYDVFCAINDCGLVYDGGLVVDPSFRTVDPAIYAVGDFTRFSRIYRDALDHKEFNPREVGTYVAIKILEEQLDPDTHGSQNYDFGPSGSSSIHRGTRKPLPHFVLPRSVSCDLPGGLKFFCSKLPKLPAEPINYITDETTALKASISSTPRKRMTVLRADGFGTVVQLIYIGEDAIETRNLSVIPGLHESYLNGAVHSFESGLVGDWINYFREPWAAVLYQDKFSTLVRALKKSLEDEKGFAMILSRTFERAENAADIDVSKFRRELIGAHGELAPEETKNTVQAATMDFLKQNIAALPYYNVTQT